MMDLLISLGLWGGIRQLRDAIVLWLDDWTLRQKGLKCPVCLSKWIWKDGHEKRKNRCPVQRYCCVECGKDFCINTLAPWYWHKYSSASIILFLWYMFCGDSILNTRNLCSFAKKIPTWKTLWNWLQKFGGAIIYNSSRIKQKVSRYRAWQNDEMYLKDKPVIGTVDPQTNTIFLTPSWRADTKSLFSHLRRIVAKWKKKPRGWWTDEWQAYEKAFDMLNDVPHGTIKHRNWKFKNAKGITTNAIENIWRQFRRWLFRKNGLKHQAYVDFYVDLFEAKYNVIKNPVIMIDMLF
jgi:hypothetical protein